jgi:hypothetical protein
MKRLSRGIHIGAVVSWTVSFSLLAACQHAPWLAVARKGSLVELKKAVTEGRRHEKFDQQAVRDLAQSVLERELKSAADPDGEALLGRLSDCARSVEKPLQRRAARSDHTAGTALLTLVDAGQHLSDREWAEASQSQDGARRAAAALDATDPERWSRRGQLLNDADPRVRRAALKACINAPAPADIDTQNSILRRDPDPTCRQLAAKAIGVIGGPDASTVLGDAWPRAENSVRLAIVSGWAQARTFTAGGRERLIYVARSEPGVVGVLAAADLAKGGSDAKANGQARITRSLEFGSAEDRSLAISAASWSLGEQAKLLLRLGLTAEPEVRISALGRWLEQPAYRWPAITWLREFAESDTSAGIEARALLAANGDRSAIAGLRSQLRYQKQASRIHAARHLWLLGDYGSVAEALADDAPEVRISVSCLALGQPSDAFANTR